MFEICVVVVFMTDFISFWYMFVLYQYVKTDLTKLYDGRWIGLSQCNIVHKTKLFHQEMSELWDTQFYFESAATDNFLANR